MDKKKIMAWGKAAEAIEEIEEKIYALTNDNEEAGELLTAYHDQIIKEYETRKALGGISEDEALTMYYQAKKTAK